MEERCQEHEVIGMDAHSRKLALCHMRKVGDRIVKIQTVATTLDALETTYARQMPAGTLTVLEASTNSFSIVRRLGEIGFPAKVLSSDVLSGLSRQDRVNDRIDAENLARIYLRQGPELRAVFTPSMHGVEMRETYFAYRDAKKDMTRAANRIWSFCSRQGLDVDKRIGKRRCAELLGEAEARGWGEAVLERAKGLVNDWERAYDTCRAREKAIERAVFDSDAMRRLQQVPGVRFIGAFALVAFVEDVRRFDNPKKLVSFIGLNPTVSESGEKDGRRSVSKFGRSDLKSIFVEAAQSAMRTDNGMTKWARHLLAKGKDWNVVMVALARKLVVLCWHILMGHPAPDRERQSATASKLSLLAQRVGKDAVKAANYESGAEFVARTCSMLYCHLPEETVEEVAVCDTA